MSDTNTNTDTNDDAIQKKKNQSAEKTDVGGFIQNFAISMVGIILFIVFGTSWLYIAKLSTAKIIPHNTAFEPYTCIKNEGFGLNGSDPIKVPMNTISELDFKGLKFWGEPIGKWEQEATFASQGFIKSFNNSFISNLRKKIDNPASASNFDTFKSILVNNVVGTGFWLYDKMSMPDGVRILPDSLKIVIYGLFGLMFFPFFWIWNSMASFYYTIRTLFNGEKTSPENPNEGGYNGGLFDGVDALKNGDSIFGNAGKMFLRGLVWMPIWLIIIPLLSMFVFPAIGTFYPFFKMLFSSGYKLKEYDPFKNDKKTDSKSCLDFIKDNLIYKRTLVLVFAILNLFTCANTYLGAKYFSGVVLATILAVIFGNIFVNTEPDDATMISVKNTVEEPVLEKPAALDDDDCGPFQDQVIEAWKKLKAQNDEADRLIQQFGNSGNLEIQNEIFKLKKQRANIIEQFKKLDGKTDLNTVTVQNTEGKPVKYTDLSVAYKDFVAICAKNIENAQKEKEQKEKEQASKEQNEKEQQEAAKEQAAKEQKEKEEQEAKEQPNFSQIYDTPSEPTISGKNPLFKEKNKNNNISAAGGEKPKKTLENTDSSQKEKEEGGNSSNTELENLPSGGSSSDTSIKEPIVEPVTSVTSNPPLSSYIEDRKSLANVLPVTASSQQGIAAEDDQQGTPGLFSKWLTGSKKKPVASAPASSQQEIAAGGNETSINENKDNQNLQLEQMINLLKTQYIKQTDVTTETAKNLLKEINKDMTLLYNRDPTKYGKYSPDKIQNLILDIQAEQAKTKPNDNGYGENPNYQNLQLNPTGGQTFSNTITNLIKNPEKSSIRSSAEERDPTYTDKPFEVAYNAVNDAIIENKKLDPTTNLQDLGNREINLLLDNATKRFVNKKDTPDQNLFDIITLLLNEKNKKNNNTINVTDELTGIKGEQADKTTNMLGGSKNKQKTLKNRKQRFNIRLV